MLKNKQSWADRRVMFGGCFREFSLRRVIFSSLSALLKAYQILQNNAITNHTNIITIIFEQLYMHDEHLTIYQQLMHNNTDIIEKLLGEGGEAMLDRQILKMKDQIGEDQFNEYAQEFFKDTKINFRTFFGQEQPKPNNSVLLTTPKQEEDGEEQIKQKEIKQVKQTEQTQIVQPVAAEQQEHTNNSQEGDNDYQQIERVDLGNNKFKIKYKNGDVYQGEMQEGMKSGWGDYMYQSGQKYSGCFIEDEINGYGRYYFLSGAEYEGDWSSGMKHGIGILKFANKDVYQGSFSNDDLHGKGIYKYHNGDRFEGNFSKGKRHGMGLFEGVDGRYQKGEWVSDKFQI